MDTFFILLSLSIADNKPRHSELHLPGHEPAVQRDHDGPEELHGVC